MDMTSNPKQLIAVEFPGTVREVENFHQCCGGETELFNVFRHAKKRLDLKFRPNDPYCKSAHGDRFNTTNLVLKVIKRTKKNKDGTLQEDPEYSLEFLGVASTSFKFKALADFQLLPVSYDPSSEKYLSLVPDLVPTELHPPSWLDKKVDLFLTPLVFSRFDLPQSGFADMQMKTQKKVTVNLPPNTISQNRKSRARHTAFMSFESSNPIEKPSTEAIMKLDSNPLDHDLKKKVDDLFQQQPIWSRLGLAHQLKVDKSRISHILPCCGYYFVSRPWRALWVRFGYDPRKDPGAKIYQSLDLRINTNITIDEKTNRRRSMYFKLPIKCASAASQPKTPTINPGDLLPTAKEEDSEEEEMYRRLAYKYVPGKLPTCRQCFYQLCDIELESVQDLVHKNDGKEEFCHEKDGWLIPGTLDRCRELILSDIIKTSKMMKETEAEGS